MPISDWKYFSHGAVHAKMSQGIESGEQAAALDILIDMIRESGCDGAVFDLDHSEAGDPFAADRLDPESFARALALLGLSRFVLIDRNRTEPVWSRMLSELKTAGVQTQRFHAPAAARQNGIAFDL